MSEPNLFGVPAAKKVQRPATPNSVQAVIDTYVRMYTDRRGERPLITKKDGGLMKRLVTTYGQAMVVERLQVYMNWRDPYVAARGYTLAVFFSKWQEVAALAAPPRMAWVCRHVERCPTEYQCSIMTRLGRPVQS